MFLQELGVPGLGRSFTVASGFAVFFRMSLGAAASGLFFGLGTSAVLRVLNRRLNREENVVEVATTFTMAYLTYFVTEQVFHCSGVIGTLTYGVFINHSSFINDPKLMEDFWALVEVLLNTVLFTLGGLVWGEIIANSEPGEQFTGTDWGYLFVLYIFLMLIRFFLLFACYPITASIGLGTSLQETLFSSFAGLRGAVGIALAISLDNVVEAQGIPLYENETNRVFGFVGGIAFLTLTLNATMSGPLLKKLGLADRPALREKVIKILHWRLRQSFIDDMVTLLSEPRFHRVNFAVVRHHLPMIQDVTVAELQAAVRKFRRPKRKFLARSSVPNLTSVTQYIIPEDSAADAADGLAEINELLRGLSEESEREERLEASRLAGPGSGEIAPRLSPSSSAGACSWRSSAPATPSRSSRGSSWPATSSCAP
jgi:NhaP-type Na+/H+ or K+/H+ antiporter